MEYRGEKAQLVLDTMQAVRLTQGSFALAECSFSLLTSPMSYPPQDWNSSKLSSSFLQSLLCHPHASPYAVSKLMISLHLMHQMVASARFTVEYSTNNLSVSKPSDWDTSLTWTKLSRYVKVLMKHIVVLNRSQAFLKEGVTWGQINHPNILPFYGIYRLQDKYNRLSLISPWLANGNINTYLENHPTANRFLLVSKGSRWSSAAAATKEKGTVWCFLLLLCIQVCDLIQGISYLHKEIIIHGDLKGVRTVTNNMLQESNSKMSYSQIFSWQTQRELA
jgi:hypothetical protein